MRDRREAMERSLVGRDLCETFDVRNFDSDAIFAASLVPRPPPSLSRLLSRPSFIGGGLKNFGVDLGSLEETDVRMGMTQQLDAVDRDKLHKCRGAAPTQLCHG